MSARAVISLAPGFSRVCRPCRRANRFYGLPDRTAETIEAVPASLILAAIWLKPGVNRSETWNLGFGAFAQNPQPAEVT